MYKLFLCLFQSTVLLCVSGCSGGHASAPVHGKVTLAGQPVGPGRIVLQPDVTAGDVSRPNVVLSFGDDGAYTGDAPIGKYKVTIQSPQDEEAEGRGELPKSRIPPQYADPSAKLLGADIKDGDNLLDFDLKPMR